MLLFSWMVIWGNDPLKYPKNCTTSQQSKKNITYSVYVCSCFRLWIWWLPDTSAHKTVIKIGSSFCCCSVSNGMCFTQSVSCSEHSGSVGGEFQSCFILCWSNQVTNHFLQYFGNACQSEDAQDVLLIYSFHSNFNLY